MLYAEASTGAVRIAWASCTAIAYGCSNASLKLLNFRWESHTAAALINILGEIARRLGGSRCTRMFTMSQNCQLSHGKPHTAAAQIQLLGKTARRLGGCMCDRLATRPVFAAVYDFLELPAPRRCHVVGVFT